MYIPYRRFFRIGRRDLAYLKFIIEAYDGVAILSTVDREGPLVKIASTPSLAAELDLLLKALSSEIAMSEIEPPQDPDAVRTGEYHA